MKKPELLAPAGSMEMLTAALRCGADAVYVGLKTFSARQNAVNFDFNELNEAVKLCHLYGKKLYLTVNTVIFDSQTKAFAETIERAVYAGIDAFIVQDLGAAKIIRTMSPQARLHASTQMSIHSRSGVLTAKGLGFKRVVLARELSKEQIAELSALGIETEMFVHGALCMSVSGQCYMSALIGRRSANRGLCAQPCRLPFSSTGNKEYCGLSLKDLSLAEHINEIIRTGVTSLKIEGRMKRPEYVAAAVSAFRAVLDGKHTDLQTLKAVFSRSGFTDGYFTGKTVNMFGKREKEDVVSAKDVFPKLHELYRTERKIADINFYAKIKANAPLELTAADDQGNKITVMGERPERAEKRAVDINFLERQLCRLGDTVYRYGGAEAEIDDGLAVSAGELNSMRRNATAALDAERIRKNTSIRSVSHILPQISGIPQRLTEIRARIANINQLEAARSADRIIVPLEILPTQLSYNVEKIIIEPPAFLVNEQETLKRLYRAKQLGFRHLICNNIAYLQIGKELGFVIHGDFRLNTANSYSANLLADLKLEDITLSLELKTGQILGIKSPVTMGVLAYGRLPVMMTKNCPIKNEIGCKRCKKRLSDRTGRSFPVVCHEGYTEILNSQRLYLADKLGEFKNISFITLWFTDESPTEVSEIIRRYRHGGDKMENITRGLYFRGVL